MKMKKKFIFFNRLFLILVIILLFSINCAGADNSNTGKKYIQAAGEVINPATGRIWMDRNLGASRVAISSIDTEAFGDLYQWGRGVDGHQKRNSATTTTQSSTDNPGHGHFIIFVNPFGVSDWRSPQSDDLWQGVNGINNPCPDGFRIPSEAEWTEEIATWSSKNAEGAFASPLKLPMGGYRIPTDGKVDVVGRLGYYWSSSVGESDSRRLGIVHHSARIQSDSRMRGLSVRCIKD
jgi:uncharacterized protein (TIGR02145 family)